MLTGAAGAGRALDATLRERGHHVLTVGRTSGDLRYDLTTPIGSRPLYEAAGPVDAVVSAAGSVPCKPLSEMTPADWHSASPARARSPPPTSPRHTSAPSKEPGPDASTSSD
ncbi:short chain dehydrogenase [Streptomyces pristinaespiralis ATCC 25486]|uniref:Short chain dehydrogenase n=1 Tax=Streptomyces pristinaespiralis (strain ATCC 25486 / DSM 40338 / CBS 914.69 / JCM 4507 / KCC S-0507 / NBRC 13074 / NRRL 2958 / 5647) TaxID=457429 RepID=B5H874_STRE2|nr:short chain dehydrogenase [Streptomyces pristinaespiralis ATCC 25486]